MKELSIEEKAKAYDEALKRAKKLYERGTITESLSYIFPELKEGEGEQSKNWILEYLYDGLRKSDEQFKDQFKAAIAWLEKQGEQKPAVIIPKFRIGDYVKNVNDKRNPIYEIVYMDKECYVCEYRGKENIGDKAVMHFAFDYPYLRQIHKTAWSEEDEEIYRKCICAMRASACGFPEEEKFVEQVDNWLKSLKDRVQPKQEWSEEDRKIIIELIGIFESAVDGGHVSFPYRLIKDYIRVLKSCLPQTTWKPSEEMLEALYRVIPENVMEKSENEMLLDKLYQGLKYGRVLSEK